MFSNVINLCLSKKNTAYIIIKRNQFRNCMLFYNYIVRAIQILGLIKIGMQPESQPFSTKQLQTTHQPVIQPVTTTLPTKLTHQPVMEQSYQPLTNPTISGNNKQVYDNQMPKTTEPLDNEPAKINNKNTFKPIEEVSDAVRLQRKKTSKNVWNTVQLTDPAVTAQIYATQPMENIPEIKTQPKTTTSTTDSPLIATLIAHTLSIATLSNTNKEHETQQNHENLSEKERPHVCLEDQNDDQGEVILDRMLDPDLQNALGPVCLFSGIYEAKHNERITIDKENMEMYFVIATCALNELIDRVNTISCDKEMIKNLEKSKDNLAINNFYRNLKFFENCILTKENDKHEEIGNIGFLYPQTKQKCVNARIDIKLNDEQKKVLEKAKKIISYINEDIKDYNNDGVNKVLDNNDHENDIFYWKNLQNIVLEQLICQSKQMKLVFDTINSYIAVNEKLKEAKSITMPANENLTEQIKTLENNVKNFFVYVKMLDLCVVCLELSQPCTFAKNESICVVVKHKKFRQMLKKDSEKLINEIQSVILDSDNTSITPNSFYFETWVQQYKNYLQDRAESNKSEIDHNDHDNKKVVYKQILEEMIDGTEENEINAEEDDSEEYTDYSGNGEDYNGNGEDYSGNGEDYNSNGVVNYSGDGEDYSVNGEDYNDIDYSGNNDQSVIATAENENSNDSIYFSESEGINTDDNVGGKNDFYDASFEIVSIIENENNNTSCDTSTLPYRAHSVSGKIKER